jgi:hypothetical protein
MPKGPRAAHLVKHTALQRGYLMSCTAPGSDNTQPDPLLLQELGGGVFALDVQLHEEADISAAARLLARAGADPAVGSELSAVVVSSGELRGPDPALRVPSWDAARFPRAATRGTPDSPSKAVGRDTGGKVKPVFKALSRALRSPPPPPAPTSRTWSSWASACPPASSSCSRPRSRRPGRCRC